METPQIPGYRIEREIGRGYSRTSYLAYRDVGYGERKCVVKVFRTEDVNPGVRDEQDFIGLRKILENEAGFLDDHAGHQNLVRYYGSGRICSGKLEGSYWISEEFVEGTRLSEKLGKMEVREIFGIFSEMVDCLQYLHRNGFVLRDFTLDNFIVPNKDTPKIKFVDLETIVPPGTQIITKSRSLRGKNFRAPELAGTNPRVTVKSDLYGLGAALL